MIFKPFLNKFVVVFIDYIIIYSKIDVEQLYSKRLFACWWPQWCTIDMISLCIDSFFFPFMGFSYGEVFMSLWVAFAVSKYYFNFLWFSYISFDGCKVNFDWVIQLICLIVVNWIYDMKKFQLVCLFKYCKFGVLLLYRLWSWVYG